MKSSAKNIEQEYPSLFEGNNMSFVDTNPFSKGNVETVTQKAGKRPRIMKPLYSVRLS